MAAIVTSGLTKHYGHTTPIGRPGRPRSAPIEALVDLAIEVEDGEIFGFLGPNGSGKSTAIRLLLGFLHPTAGHASVLGFDAERESVEIRRRVGYLPGGVAFWDGLTGERLLDELAAMSGRPPVRRAELVERLELSPATLRRAVRDYSRGMRQKLGVVQALQHDPELAILDEPTEGLDPLMQYAFYGILDDLRRAGRTIFFSSHILSEVERVCDRVAIVRRGRLVALEDIHTLLAHRKRNVEMRVGGVPPVLTGVAGVSDVQASDGRVRCRLEGDVGPFLAAIAGHEIHDLTIEPARLEEAFLEFYAEDAAVPVARGADPAGADPAGADPAGAAGPPA